MMRHGEPGGGAWPGGRHELGLLGQQDFALIDQELDVVDHPLRRGLLSPHGGLSREVRLADIPCGCPQLARTKYGYRGEKGALGRQRRGERQML
jgi:hypothetical protein